MSTYYPIQGGRPAVQWTGANRDEVEAFAGPAFIQWLRGNPLVRGMDGRHIVQPDRWLHRSPGESQQTVAVTPPERFAAEYRAERTS